MVPLELILKIPDIVEHSLPSIAALGAGSLAAQQLTWYITQYAHAQAEHRANGLACKKLIELDELRPIIDRLSGLRASFNNSVYRQPYGPAAKEEYQHMENVLKENGYNVIKKPFPTYQNYAGCLQITKDGQVKAESATCAYLR